MPDNCHINIINNSSHDLTGGKYIYIAGEYMIEGKKSIKGNGDETYFVIEKNKLWTGSNGNVTFTIGQSINTVKFIYKCPFSNDNLLNYETESKDIGVHYYGISGKGEKLEEIPLNAIDSYPTKGNPLSGLFIVFDKH